MAAFKCIVIGDSAVGKTALISILTNKSTSHDEYNPTVFQDGSDDNSVSLVVGGKQIILNLWDTAGQDKYDELRKQFYPGVDVCLICFSVVSPISFTNVQAKWYPEIKEHAPAIILVGTKSDLREETVALDSPKHEVSYDQALIVAKKMSAHRYLECSVWEQTQQRRLRSSFEEAIGAALSPKP